MANDNLIDDSQFAELLRRLTTPVGQKELEEFVHYEHIHVLREASHRLGLFVLLRRTNSESIKFIGYPGFVPKSLACKPKTAKSTAKIVSAGGQAVVSMCAGLVVDPRKTGISAFQDNGQTFEDAISTWDKYWSTGPPSGFVVQLDPESGYFGCVMRCGQGTQVFPQSRTNVGKKAAEAIRTQVLEQPGQAGFQLLPDKNIDQHALDSLPMGCSYVHGDYDLYALVHKDALGQRTPRQGEFEGEAHTYSKDWKAFEAIVRSRIGIDMIQHGSQENFSGHTDETIDIFCPTRQRALWHVKVVGESAINRLFTEAFKGRQPHNA